LWRLAGAAALEQEGARARLPAEIIAKTAEKYREAQRLLTGAAD